MYKCGHLALASVIVLISVRNTYFGRTTWLVRTTGSTSSSVGKSRPHPTRLSTHLNLCVSDTPKTLIIGVLPWWECQCLRETPSLAARHAPLARALPTLLLRASSTLVAPCLNGVITNNQKGWGSPSPHSPLLSPDCVNTCFVVVNRMRCAHRTSYFAGGARDCDHWHAGPGFVTSHIALTLMFEQSLQSINPSIALPYWDFTIEGTYFDWTNFRLSSVFSDDWFGQAAPDNVSHKTIYFE